MAKSLSFNEVLNATAKQKTEAAKARNYADPTAVKPKDVISEGCEMIGDQLKRDGFTFIRSGPRLKRVHGDITQEISFQSDRNNIAGRRAAMWIHAAVSSRKLAQWRSTHPSNWVRLEGRGAGRIVGAQIGNLSTPRGWMEWDFADEVRRQAVINDGVAAIRRIIFPFFALFEDPTRCIEALIHYDMPWQVSLLEYALSSLGKETAEKFGRMFLQQNARVRERFETAYAEFVKSPPPPRVRGELGHDLASLAVETSLDLTSYD